MRKHLLQFFIAMGILLLAMNLPAQTIPAHKQILVEYKETADTIFLYSNTWHKCNWRFCHFTNSAILVSLYKNGWSDNYLFYDMDKLHFAHPNWTWEQVYFMADKQKKELNHANL